jgi:hypothetical protein
VWLVLRRTAALIALAAALATGVGACSSGGGDEPDVRSARVGETFEAVLWSEIEGRLGTIIVPGLRYDLLVTSPRERMDSVSAREAGVADEATEGTRFVGLTWGIEAAGGEAMTLAGEGPDVTAELALVVDGETVDLVPPEGSEGVRGWWVVVPADADRIGVALTYDGVTQMIEDVADPLAAAEGGSRLLYDGGPDGLHQPACPEPAQGPEPERYVIGSCTVSISDPFPYHRGLGWADDGHGWVVVRLRMRSTTVGWDDDASTIGFEVTADEAVVTLDGAEPVELLPSEPDGAAGVQDDGTWMADVVFSVPIGTQPEEVLVTRPYVAVADDVEQAAADGVPAELTGAYEITIPID